jgi:hypothetical protein
MEVVNRPTSSQECRYFIAAMMKRGFSLSQISRMSGNSKSDVRSVWRSNEYSPQAHELNIGFSTLADGDDELPTYVALIEEGKELSEQMGRDNWLTYRVREKWIEKHSD